MRTKCTIFEAFWAYFSDGDSLCKGDLSNQDSLISLSQDEPLTKNLSYPFYIHDVVQGTCHLSTIVHVPQR